MSDDRVRTRELIAGFLANSDARCPACRYALRGCTSDKCPECGCELSLQIASSRNSSAWWLAGVIGLSAGSALAFLGMLGMASIILEELQNPGLRLQVRAGFAPQSQLPAWKPICFFALLFVMQSFVLALLASRREAFLSWPLSRRAIVGSAAAAAPLILCGLLAAFARWV